MKLLSKCYLVFVRFICAKLFICLLIVCILPMQALNAKSMVNTYQSSLKQQLDSLVQNKKVTGIIVSLVTLDSVITETAGYTGLGADSSKGKTPDENTIFEIASITKAFTGLLLAQAILEGRITETSLVKNYLPDFVLPQSSKAITVLDLATHYSGIPRAYDEKFIPRDPLNPWADFDLTQLKLFLARTKLITAPGDNYSNIGAGLVGHVLERVYRLPFETLIKYKISNPLGLKDTAIQLNPEQQSRMANSYSIEPGGKIVPIPHWQSPSIPAAGALKSSMSNMTQIARALINPKSHLFRSFNYSRADRAPLPNASKALNMKSTIGLFWVNSLNQFTWHNGATYGMSSFIGINPTKHSALIILSNSYSNEQIATVLGLSLMK